ncbi:SDR family oxidoreductase [Sorangium sp. So ce1504]|uniref:SDR family oxidoreductase n=1 Tax=Sorangium sp. So ce1504 TaxID=3133337 RepID=UPI003F630408
MGVVPCAAPRASVAQRGKTYPVGRLLRPEEVAPTIVFLCSAANNAVTGEIARASGGRPM